MSSTLHDLPAAARPHRPLAVCWQSVREPRRCVLTRLGVVPEGAGWAHAVGGTGGGLFLSSMEVDMATATTTEMAKIVRRVLDEELGDDSEAMLKGIQRVTRLLTEQVIPQLSEASDAEEPRLTTPAALRANKPIRSVKPTARAPAGTPVPEQPGEPESPAPEEVVEALEALYSSLSLDQSQALAAFFTALSRELEEEGAPEEDDMDVRCAALDALTTLAQRKPAAFQAAVDALTPYIAEEEDGTFSLAAPKRVINALDQDAYAALMDALDQTNQMMRDATAGAVGARGIKIPWKLIWGIVKKLGKKLPWYRIACATTVVVRNQHKYPGDPPQRRWLEAAARDVIGSCL